MGCGGSKHGSHGKGRSNSVEDSYTARRQRVSVRIGGQVRRLDTQPNIIFIFGKRHSYMQIAFVECNYFSMIIYSIFC